MRQWARSPVPMSQTRTVRVLVVEDERRLAGAVQRGLQAEGFAVDLAFDGDDGLHLAREGAYDAVVLDLMLPGLSGYQVCERLRAEENWVPVLKPWLYPIFPMTCRSVKTGVP